MASVLSNTLFQPIFTGPLLWALTRGSPEIRDRILRPLAQLPFKLEEGTLVTGLKWLFALGVVGKINGFLNRWALNKWLLSDKGAAFNPPREIAVITGGSGGIAVEIIKNLAPTGMKIAILDISPPPASIKDCMFQPPHQTLSPN